MEAGGGRWGRTDPPLGWCLPIYLPAIQTRGKKKRMEKETRAQLEEEPFIDKSTNDEKVSGFLLLLFITAVPNTKLCAPH